MYSRSPLARDTHGSTRPPISSKTATISVFTHCSAHSVSDTAPKRRSPVVHFSHRARRAGGPTSTYPSSASVIASSPPPQKRRTCEPACSAVSAALQAGSHVPVSYTHLTLPTKA